MGQTSEHRTNPKSNLLFTFYKVEIMNISILPLYTPENIVFVSVSLKEIVHNLETEKGAWKNYLFDVLYPPYSGSYISHCATQ